MVQLDPVTEMKKMMTKLATELQEQLAKEIKSMPHCKEISSSSWITIQHAGSRHSCDTQCHGIASCHGGGRMADP